MSICEQTEDPKLAKGLVRREVVETITPVRHSPDDLLDGTREQLPVRTDTDRRLGRHCSHGFVDW